LAYCAIYAGHLTTELYIRHESTQVRARRGQHQFRDLSIGTLHDFKALASQEVSKALPLERIVLHNEGYEV
jgi:hypothetical protein